VGDRIWGFVLCEHIIIGLKIALAYIIPDVPEKTQEAMEREAYRLDKVAQDALYGASMTEVDLKDMVDDDLFDKDDPSDLQWLNISWMFWPNKGVAGYFDRDPGLIMKELGLPHRKQTDHLHMTSPHVLALQSGNWDVQERPVTSFEQEMPKFLAILRAWLPQTRIIWLGPLHLKVKGEAWRTSFRLEEHARMLSRLLRPHDIPLITAHSMYSAIDNTCDGRHFELQYYLDWFNLLLNEWLRVDDEVVRRLLPVSDLSTRTPG